MDKLLPYFERELGMLRLAGQAFAQRYPKLAGSLQINGESCADPHVERLLQGTALLNARTAKLLDDSYAGFTEALLGVLYPHYLRPFPSCSIARIDYRNVTANALGKVTVVPRGTEMRSRDQDGLVCRFRSVYDVTIAPVAISELRFDPIIQTPPALRLPAQVTSAIRIGIEALSPQMGLDHPGMASLRLFIDGEASLRAALRDALFMRTGCALVEADGEWRMLDHIPLAAVGFADTDALLPAAASEHAAYRLLSEYFAFPEKFDFIDIDLAALLRHAPPGCRTLTLTLGLTGLRHDAAATGLLRTLSADRLVPACTPVINLFQHSAAPIHVNHTRSSYPLLPHKLSAAACEIYSVDSVQLLRNTESGSDLTEFVPYYSLRHGQTQNRKGHYWLLRRDGELAAMGNAHEFSLSLVDRDFSALRLEAGTTSVQLSCTNRALPPLLRHGHADGDLSCEAVPPAFPIRLLRRPTAPQRIASAGGAHWGLIAHLTLNHHTLTQTGLPALLEILRLYAQADDAVSQRQIDSIGGLTHQATTAWLRSAGASAYLRGIEIRVTLDQEAFAGTGLHVFAQVLEHFFSLHVHMNSFTQLVVLCETSGKELLRCPPRNGLLALI
ncbi:type VI secretion system baseplate subunit TssF [Oxalobacteraceae bacterium]|nr:type VI secretion system baseplate subunit TssF [Oxalobacteraceae bacterium]